ncbi:hypothetical protein SLE2022_401520 [Rubroshorea leprosula]
MAASFNGDKAQLMRPNLLRRNITVEIRRGRFRSNRSQAQALFTVFFCPLTFRHRISTCTNKRNHDRTQKSRQKTRSNIYLRRDGEGGVVERRRKAEATGHSRGDGNRGVIFELLFCLIQK